MKLKINVWPVEGSVAWTAESPKPQEHTGPISWSYSFWLHPYGDVADYTEREHMEYGEKHEGSGFHTTIHAKNAAIQDIARTLRNVHREENATVFEVEVEVPDAD